jgi:hypothetical protein
MPCRKEDDAVPHGNKQQRIDLESPYDTGAWWTAPAQHVAVIREIEAASYRYSYRYIRTYINRALDTSVQARTVFSVFLCRIILLLGTGRVSHVLEMLL